MVPPPLATLCDTGQCMAALRDPWQPLMILGNIWRPLEHATCYIAHKSSSRCSSSSSRSTAATLFQTFKKQDIQKMPGLDCWIGFSEKTPNFESIQHLGVTTIVSQILCQHCNIMFPLTLSCEDCQQQDIAMHWV